MNANTRSYKVNLEVYKGYDSKFRNVPYYILDKLNNNFPADKIIIAHDKPDFQVDGLVHMCQFYYRNNYYEFYFQKEDSGQGQFILYYNHQQVLSTLFMRENYDWDSYYKDRERLLAFEEATRRIFGTDTDSSDIDLGPGPNEIDIMDQKITVMCNIQEEYTPPMYRDLDGFRTGTKNIIKRNHLGTVVSEDVDANFWILELIDCKDYLEELEKQQKLNQENKENEESASDINNEEDVITLAAKLAKKLLK